MKATGKTAPFVFSREVKAPVERVWEAWTEEEELRKWWGPKEAEIISVTNDFRVGGEFTFHHRVENVDIMGKHVYREIAAPNRMVFVGSFCDAKGEIARNPFEKNWPLKLLETIEFSGNDGLTKVTITWDPISPTDVERRAFDKELGDCVKGWTGLFERLEDHLSAH